MTNKNNENVSPIHPRPEVHGSNGGNGNLVNYRLNQLEEKVGKIEETLQSVNQLCIKIDTKLDEKASKSYVLTTFSVALVVAVTTIIAHVIIRYISGG